MSANNIKHYRLRLTLYKIRHSPTTMVGIAIVMIFVILALFGEYIAPYPEDAYTIHIERKFIPPSPEHPFGTDAVGRDILSRVILATRVSLSIGVGVVILAVLIGFPLGLLVGYIGGPLEALVMRLTDIFLSIPSVVLAMAIAAMVEPTLQNAMFALVIGWWPWYTRLGFGLASTLKNEDYVLAAKSFGAGWKHIVFREILPNAIPILAVKASLDIGYAILAEALLGFIGFGVRPPTPEWGTMLSEARIYLPDIWWYATFPGLAIFLAVMGFNLLGDGLRDILDVREV
ncbi:MAG: D-ala-D-ala transporter subunit [Desulfurococcales archaeon ex4484_217_2]|nr:MAG: D-ala-D-ala transporter subunit [Desulfurococcales archaeon ex4484_217_2]